MGTYFLTETAKAKGLGKGARAVLRELADAADNKTGKLFRAQKTLATDTGYGLKSIYTHLLALENMGWIERVKRHKPNGARQSDIIRVRSFAEATEWALANTSLPTEDAPAVDLPEPANDAAPATCQPVNTPTRHASPGPIAAEIDNGPVEKIQENLTIRLQTEGLDGPPLPTVDPRMVRDL